MTTLVNEFALLKQVVQDLQTTKVSSTLQHYVQSLMSHPSILLVSADILCLYNSSSHHIMSVAWFTAVCYDILITLPE